MRIFIFCLDKLGFSGGAGWKEFKNRRGEHCSPAIVDLIFTKRASNARPYEKPDNYFDKLGFMGEFYVHFFSSAKRNEPKKRRLRRRGSAQAKDCAIRLCSDILSSLRTLLT